MTQSLAKSTHIRQILPETNIPLTGAYSLHLPPTLSVMVSMTCREPGRVEIVFVSPSPMLTI